MERLQNKNSEGSLVIHSQNLQDVNFTSLMQYSWSTWGHTALIGHTHIHTYIITVECMYIRTHVYSRTTCAYSERDLMYVLHPMFSTLGYTDGCNCCSNSEIDVFSSNSTSAQICDGEEGTHVPCLCENGENKVSAGLSERTRICTDIQRHICTQIYRDTSVHRYTETHLYTDIQRHICTQIYRDTSVHRYTETHLYTDIQRHICTQIYRDTSVHRYHTYGPTQSCLCIVYVQTVTLSISFSILQCGTRYASSGSNSNCYLDTDGDKIPDVEVGCEQEDPTAMCMSCVSQLRVACT